MKIVIQCAGSKQKKAGKLRNSSGQEVIFVADTEACSLSELGAVPVRPDDLRDDSMTTWREYLVDYNSRGSNPQNLLRAGDLYSPHAYSALGNKFGEENIFILSAGWGLVRYDYFLPDYNVTFSGQCKKNKPWAYRHKISQMPIWPDFNHFDSCHFPSDEAIHFFGGKDYLPLFYSLTSTIPAKKVIHFKGQIKTRSGYQYCEFFGNKNQNWHYEATEAFIRTQA